MRGVRDGMKFQAIVLKSGNIPSIFTSNQLIHLYSNYGLIREANNVFDEMPDRNVYTWNAIIYAHMKTQNLSKAQLLFDASPCKNSVTYNTMITGYAANGGEACENQAVKLFLQMQQQQGEGENARVDEFSLTTMLNLAAKLGYLSWGTQIHASMVKTANGHGPFAVSSLIDMYSKCRNFQDVCGVFFDGSSPVAEPFTKNAMVAACAREGELEMAKKIFLHEPEINDVVSWNTMVAGFVQNGDENAALEMFTCMVKEGYKWNEHTLASVLSACSGLKNLQVGKQLHSLVIKEGIFKNPFISSGVVELYCKSGNMKSAESVYAEIVPENSFAITSMIVGYSRKDEMLEAKRLFDCMVEKNYVVWTAMISGYVKSNQCKQAFELFGKFMAKHGETLDALMLVNLLRACSLQATVDPGKQIHGNMFRIGIEMDEVAVSAVVDMYSKCGNIKYARDVFQRLAIISRDVVLYNVMIAGYAHHGHESEAIDLFEELIGNGLEPDAVTFLAILAACRHRGMVEAGEKYFSSMTEHYAILPESDHYACMIDLYGRANQLEKASLLMEKIPVQIQTDAVILGSFLNACKMNRNAQLAKAAENKLFNVERENGARYVQLASVYASEAKWDEKGRIMKNMRSNEVKKVAGCSWVHIGNRLHTFTSGDTTHSATQLVYATLECLLGELQDKMTIEIELSC